MTKYLKAIVAGIAVAIATAIPLVGDGLSAQDVLIVAGAFLAGAFPTWAVPNRDAGEDGGVEPGSLALGLVIGLGIAYLVFR